jgi:predicted ATPase/class 3 adenylate cyclase
VQVSNQNNGILKDFARQMELPGGIITLVFTDIENSSELSERLRADFEPIRETHFALLREAAARWNGIEVGTAGDSVFLAFVHPSDAVQWAVDAQLALLRQDWQGVPLHVRIGIHTGEPYLSTTPRPNYYGPPVNRAARVMDAAHGGQIILSHAVYTLLQNERLEIVTFRDWGIHRLKGVGEERLWQLLHPELRQEFPTLRTLNAERHNLPQPSTPFIGHELEIRAWEEKLHDRNARLLTITGFGGMGKTRAALHLAELCTDQFENGVWWIALEEARNADDFWRKLAEGLRLNIQTSLTLPEQVRQFLRDRQVLLVLDNVEQVPRAAEAVKSLLESAPQIKVLTTSRRVLGLRAETVLELPPLSELEAQRLFVERAQALQADFMPSEENAEDIAALCRELEGVPLAIELAASRIVGMSPRQMRQRLSERFRLLQTRAPDLPDRQRALRAAIDWSYDLLSEDEREVFHQLGVFAGGFAMEDAEAVCEAFDVFESVMELRNHSFFRAETDPHTQESRFVMLENLRAYALDRLKESDSICEAVRQRHAAYFLNYARERVRKFRTSDERPARRQLETNSANLRAAMDWAKTTNDALLFAELALMMGIVLQRRGFLRDAQEPLKDAQEALVSRPTENEALTARIYAERAGVALDLGDAATACTEADAALVHYQSLNDEIGQAAAHNLLGQAAVLDRRYADARGHYTQALDAYTRANRRTEMAIVNNNIGILEYTDRDGAPERSRTALEEALRLHSENQSQRGMAEAYNNLGVLAHYGEQWEVAKQHYLASLHIRQTLRHGYGAALVLTNLGEIAETQQRWEPAVRCFAAAEALFRESQSPHAEYAADYLLKTVPQTDFTVEGLRRDAKNLPLDRLILWATENLN